MLFAQRRRCYLQRECSAEGKHGNWFESVTHVPTEYILEDTYVGGGDVERGPNKSVARFRRKRFDRAFGIHSANQVRRSAAWRGVGTILIRTSGSCGASRHAAVRQPGHGTGYAVFRFNHRSGRKVSRVYNTEVRQFRVTTILIFRSLSAAPTFIVPTCSSFWA